MPTAMNDGVLDGDRSTTPRIRRSSTAILADLDKVQADAYAQ